jgi:hypothetical protein
MMPIRSHLILPATPAQMGDPQVLVITLLDQPEMSDDRSIDAERKRVGFWLDLSLPAG